MKKNIVAFGLGASLLCLPAVTDAADVSRGEFLKSMMTSLDVEVHHYDTESLPFEDVNDEYKPYVAAALELGITTGRTETTFGTDDPVTRAHASLFLTRAMNLQTDNLDAIERLTDIDENSWGVEAIAATAAYGIMTGYSDGSIRPAQTIYPHQVESILNRVDERFDRYSIVHTNDIHGRVVEELDEDVMGLPRVHTIYNHIKETSEDTLLLDAGDTFHGTNNVHFTEGQAMVDLMNHIGFDAMAAGNHEFNYGYERLVELSEQANFDVLASNVIVEETGDPLLERNTILELGDKTVGVIGIVTEDTPIRTHPSNVEGLAFYDDVEIAQREVEAMQDDVDHVILLTHSGHAVEQTMAEEIEGVDLVIGGHSHTAVERPFYESGTFVAQAHEHTKAVGVVNMFYYEDELASMNGQLIRDDGTRFENHPDTEEKVRGVVSEVEEALGEVVGESSERLIGDREVVRSSESNLGNLITDAMRERTGADIAFMNGGGIRDSIDAGEVTMHDVVNAFPFINLVEAQKMTGDVVVQALEESVSLYPESNGGFLHVSGMSFTYDPNAEPYNRVQDVMIGDEPLDTEAEYVVGTNDFLAAGGDGYSMFSDQEIVLSTGELLSEILIDYFQSGATIPSVEDRITQVES
ncbi:5'-nucleotidase C-terminal domain-containing protein [Geomicrobium sp. JSM 1781026]|uniref:5'-nucleotidase C-terminal domain-containing protein n=1 Tax=Geomicrobium sp. JSM 1781026 TaxID=3344580 RepID=UPI0035C0B1BD